MATKHEQVEKEGRVGRIRPYDESGIVRGADGVLRYERQPESLLALLRGAVETDPDAEALVEVGGARLTYRGLWDGAARVAGGLRADGIRNGDRVANRFGNGTDWCLAFVGTVMAGAVMVPINTRFAEPEVEYVVGDAGARAVLGPEAPLPDAAPFVADDVEPADTAALWYTSGTTGFPKGAVMTHANFVSIAETVERLRFASAGAAHGLRTLISVPLFHVTGCISQLVSMWQIAGASVIMPALDVQQFLRTIVDERIDVVTSVPAIFWYAMNQPNFHEFDMSRVGWATYGGAPMPPQQVEQMRDEFPNARLGNGFGLTETSSVATFLPSDYAVEHADSVGFAAPPVELDLADVDPATGAGELLIRGPQVVAGYWNKPEATEAAFVDGWLHTGDVARIDEDGFVFVVDRVKDMINRGGENVYSVEVENALTAHPGVFEVAVVGVPDAMMGEKVGAIVVPKPGGSVDPAELVEFARGRLADFKLPQYVAVRSEPLPRNPGGKILKRQLRDETDWPKPLR